VNLAVPRNARYHFASFRQVKSGKAEDMPTYIQLLTLTPDGRAKVLYDSESVLRAQDEVRINGVQVLGLYGVLGEFDFVSIVEAPDNESIARYSLELGVKGGVSIVTLPSIPISRLEGRQELTPLEPLLKGEEEPV